MLQKLGLKRYQLHRSCAMGQFFGLGWLLLLMIGNIDAQKKPSTSVGIHSACLGSVMRINIGPLGGNLLEVAAGVNYSAIPLTPTLASQCGFRMKMDPRGNAVIFASLQNCFARNVGDKTFTTVLNLRLHGNQMERDELHQVAETCHHAAWASREILCDRNYMEVSVKKAIPDDYALPDHPNVKSGDPRRAADSKTIPSDAGARITTVVFYTPEPQFIPVDQAQKKGYGVTNTPTRLVLRSPPNAAETYTQDVAAVPMAVLKTSVVFEKKWLMTQIDAAAACPTPMGGVSCTQHWITWYLPWHIDPLISTEQFKLLELHMGIDGQRVDTAEMAARQYSMSVNDVHVIVQIPVGAVGGHFKSHVKDGQCFTSYTIEPMLEMLWTEDAHEETRYKVLFPITTPLMSQPPQVIDNTVPEERIFKVLLGSLGYDVILANVTFSAAVLSVADCNSRGFNIQEQESHNGSTKAFTLHVPFTDPLVLQTRERGMTFYSLQLTFGLLVLPEFAPFAHTAYLEAALVDKVSPSISGSCSSNAFYITVRYGQGVDFQTIVGKRLLTPAQAQQYNFMTNATHFSISVPFSAADAVIEALQSSSIRTRLDVALSNPKTNTYIQDYSLACNFRSTLSECFPNGTMTALAIKLSSVPHLDPSQLVLRDPACRPAFSDHRTAYFVFTTNSCGTTRKFLPNAMVYENEISLPGELASGVTTDSKTEDFEYELKVTCYYDISSTHAVSFLSGPRNNEPFAASAKGDLHIAMRLALDDSYSSFYGNEDYPVAKYLRQPLYFEVALMRSTNPKVELVLENCWATQSDYRTSQLRWNIIINGCANPVDPYQVVSHPVWPDARVQYPSHFKRFEVQMFAFAMEQDDSSQQIFVHCDVSICDTSKAASGLCSGQCSNQEGGIKGQRRAVPNVQDTKRTSSGPILIMHAK